MSTEEIVPGVSEKDRIHGPETLHATIDAPDGIC